MDSSVPPIPASQPRASAALDGLAGLDRRHDGRLDGVDFDVVIGPADEGGAVPVSYKFANVDDAVTYTRLVKEQVAAAVVRAALAGVHNPSSASLALAPLEPEDRRGSAAPSPKAAHSDYYDQYTSPLTKRRYLDLARRGAFPRSKVGKQVLVLRSVLDAYIAHCQVHVTPRSRPEDGDEADELLTRVGLRRVKP